jgi:2-polyprenyl-3-methyl-5-hydroxy-6-metoxy-1,4-benzoquinol methylase
MWDERFNTPDYIYGTTPNTFLKANVGRLPHGKILSIAEGEGRNAVFLAGAGYDVTAVDSSEVGLAKARKLATEHNVTITTECADLSTFNFGRERWDGVVSIFCHLPPAIRPGVHNRIVNSLKPGGVLLLEGYAKNQLAYKTGGPQTLEMLFDLEETKTEFAGLSFEQAGEIVRDVREGSGHTGLGAVVQIVGVTP